MAVPDLARWQAWFRRAPFVADIGAELLAVAPGECESRLLLAPRHLQHTGQAHAAVVTLLADHTAGTSAQTLLAEGGGMVLTAELKLSLLRPAQGEQLRCLARVIKSGRQLMFTESEVFARQGEREQLVAKFSATMAVVGATAR